MSDVTFTHSGETAMTGIEGNTEAGVVFVDSITVREMTVVDSGRIIVWTRDIPDIRMAASIVQVTCEDVKGL